MAPTISERASATTVSPCTYVLATRFSSKHSSVFLHCVSYVARRSPHQVVAHRYTVRTSCGYGRESKDELTWCHFAARCKTLSLDFRTWSVSCFLDLNCREHWQRCSYDIAPNRHTQISSNHAHKSTACSFSHRVANRSSSCRGENRRDAFDAESRAPAYAYTQSYLLEQLLVRSRFVSHLAHGKL